MTTLLETFSPRKKTYIFVEHPHARAEPAIEQHNTMLKGKNALITLIFFLVNGSLMMAAGPQTSSAPERFNESLRSWAGEVTAHLENDLQKVVIDAGHGGKDPGGMGKNSQEKHIALNIARLLAIGIRTNFPDVEVIMTRADDTFIPLYERAAIANKAGADLFISVHANIMPGSSATYGTETFVMGQHVAALNLEVAKRENAAILLESGDVTTNYGYDPNSAEGHILMSMQQHAYLERSILFAEAVERQFATSGRKSRGVKQAGFVVLKATTMPAVLVETGFMSNPDEEAYLLSDQGQQQLASALLQAFGEYYAQTSGDRNAPVAKRGTPVCALPPEIDQYTTPRDTRATAPRATTVTVQPAVAKEVTPTKPKPAQWTAKGVDPSPITYQANERPQPIAQPVVYQPATTYSNAAVLRKEVVSTAPGVYDRRIVPGKPAPPATPPVSYPVTYSYPAVVADSTSPTGYKFKSAKVRKAPLKPGEVDLRAISDDQLTYGLQVFATKNDLDLTRPPFNRVPYPITKIREGSMNKYQIRGLADAAAARDAKRRVKAVGVRESLVVVYLDGKRLPPPAVRYLLAR